MLHLKTMTTDNMRLCSRCYRVGFFDLESQMCMACVKQNMCFNCSKIVFDNKTCCCCDRKFCLCCSSLYLGNIFYLESKVYFCLECADLFRPQHTKKIVECIKDGYYFRVQIYLHDIPDDLHTLIRTYLVY